MLFRIMGTKNLFIDGEMVQGKRKGIIPCSRTCKSSVSKEGAPHSSIDSSGKAAPGSSLRLLHAGFAAGATISLWSTSSTFELLICAPLLQSVRLQSLQDMMLHMHVLLSLKCRSP